MANKGYLEVGTDGKGGVVVNHPEMECDENGVGHIIFSPSEARDFAAVLQQKASVADHEQGAGGVLPGVPCPSCDRPNCPTLTLGPEPIKWVWEHRTFPDGSSVGADWLTRSWIDWNARATAARWDCDAHRVDWRASCLATREELANERRRTANAAALLWAIWDDGLDLAHEEGCPGDDTCDCPVMALLNLCLGDGVHAFHRDRCDDGACLACWYLAHAEDRDRDRED